MPESDERRVPTSKELSGANPPAPDGGPAEKGKRRHRILGRFGIRKGAGERRTEAPAPKPQVALDTEQLVEEPRTASDAAPEPDPVEQQEVAELDSVEEEPSVVSQDEQRAAGSSVDKQTRRRSFGVTRLDEDDARGETEPEEPSWWPRNPNVAKKIESAIAKGHSFDGVVKEGRTQIWACSTCGRDVRLVFEQSYSYRDGVGTTAIKAKAAAWPCG